MIRQELASGRGRRRRARRRRGSSSAAARISLDRSAESGHTLDEIVDETGTDERLVRELEEYGLVRGAGRGGERSYDSIERDIVRAVVELTRFGVAPRNLRVFRTSADREAVAARADPRPGAALAQPGARARRRSRRSRASPRVVSQLKHLLLVRDLRRLVRLASGPLAQMARARRSRVIAADRARDVWRVVVGPLPPAALVAEGRPRRGRPRAQARVGHRSGRRCSRPPVRKGRAGRLPLPLLARARGLRVGAGDRGLPVREVPALGGHGDRA